MRTQMIHTPEAYTLHQREFNGIDDVLKQAKKVLYEDSQFQSDCASMQPDSGFSGTESLGEAVRLFEFGWPDGVAKAKRLIEDLDLDDTANLGSTISYAFQESGDDPDIDRYLAGETENMVEYYTDQSTMGRNVKLICNISQHCGVPAETMMRRGVIIAAALGNVSAAGFGIDLELWDRRSVSSWGRHSRASDQLEYRIPLIKSGEYFGLDSLVFGLVHPSMLRRIMFAVNETEPENIRDMFGFHSHGGYGMPECIPPADTPNTVVIDKQHYLVDTDEMIPHAVNMLTEDIFHVARAKQLQ